MQAVKVGESRRVRVGETGLGGGDVLDALVEVELAKGTGGGRAKRSSGRRGRLVAHLLSSDSYTRDEEVVIEIEGGVGCHWERAKTKDKYLYKDRKTPKTYL